MDALPLTKRWQALIADVKLSHAVFSLPLIVLGGFLALGRCPGWELSALIMVCGLSGHVYGMLVNRLADGRIDALNPRTIGRGLPSGRVRVMDVWLGIIGSVLALIGCCLLIGLLRGNWWPLVLLPVMLLWLGGYSWTKRWTWLCHLILGIGLGAGPIAGALVVRPESLVDSPSIWWLGGFTTCWVSGFDCIYALQDLSVDRREGLYSIPVLLGERGTLWVARLLHFGALACLAMTGRSSVYLGTHFEYLVAAVAVLLVLEHRAAARGRFQEAFMLYNSLLSLALSGVGIYDVLG